MSSGAKVINCSCGSILTAEEIRYYGVSCEACEKRWLQDLKDAGIDLPPGLQNPNEVLEKGKELNKLMDWPPVLLASEVMKLRAELAGVREAIPANWLDPLLTGPSAVIGRPPYDCLDIERLLDAIRARIEHPNAAPEVPK